MGACCSLKKASNQTKFQRKTTKEVSINPLSSLLANIFPPNSPSNLPNSLISLKDHLDAHPEDTIPCLTALHNKAKTALNALHPEDIPILQTILKAAESLLSLEPLQVMSIIYEIAGKCVKSPLYLQLRGDLYDTLERSSQGDFEEIGVLSDSFLAGLMLFCKQSPAQIVPRDIAQLGLLITTAHSSLLPETYAQKWEPLLAFLLERLKQDAKGVDFALIQQEKQLLITIYKGIATTDKAAHTLCLRLIGVIDKCEGWGEYSNATLEVFLLTVAKNNPRLTSQLLKLLLSTLPFRVYKGKIEEITAITDHTIAFLKAVKEQIATLTYTSTLLTAFLSLFSLPELHNSAEVLLTQWSRRTDIQSCLRILSELSQQNSPQAHVCLSSLKQCIRPRILKDWDTHIFCENWNQLLSDIINKSTRNGYLLTLHLADFVINVLGDEIRVRVNDVLMLCKIALSLLETLNSEMTANWLKTCKYCSQIWQNLAGLKLETLRNGLLKIVRKLQELAEQTDSIPVQVSLVVMMLVLAHNIGKNYDMQSLLDFATQSGKDLAVLGVYSRLFELNMWEELYDSPSFLFHKSDLSSFQVLTSRVFISPAPLRLPGFDSSLSREGTLALLKESYDPLEALQSDRSDFSPLSAGDVKFVFNGGELKAESGTTGVESAIR